MPVVSNIRRVVLLVCIAIVYNKDNRAELFNPRFALRDSHNTANAKSPPHTADRDQKPNTDSTNSKNRDFYRSISHSQLGFCKGHGETLFNGPSKSLSDCRSLCNSKSVCKFFSFWMGSAWCNLQASCDDTQPDGDQPISIFERVSCSLKQGGQLLLGNTTKCPDPPVLVLPATEETPCAYVVRGAWGKT